MQEKITAKQIADDPAASYWIKDALKTALELDPVDAANDAEVLAQVLRDRCDEVLDEYAIPVEVINLAVADAKEIPLPKSVTPPSFIEYGSGAKLCTRCLTRYNEFGN